MIAAQIPANERERQTELDRYRILDSLPEQGYDDLVKIASAICGTPMGLVSLIDRERQWFKARTGLDAGETPRDVSFCGHAIHRPGHLFIVQDALADERFVDNPLVTGDPKIRFYAGAPLVTPGGHAVGTLCVIDREPRTLEPFQIEAMQGLSRQVVALMELRRAYDQLRHHLGERDWYELQLKQYQSELEQENLHLSRQSGTDVLTGLTNRRGLNAALDWRIERAREGESLHLAIVDIDHFKMINDLHGHQVGDETLAAVAAVLKAHCGSDGTAARTGGEEFIVLLPGATAQAALRECEHLREAVAIMSGGIPVTISIGLASYRDGDGAGDLYARADKALYAAKAGGRNQVTVERD
ncbi:MAG TPA: sensor domain-containing diguanylate cyclase [Dokdonella sp.]